MKKRNELLTFDEFEKKIPGGRTTIDFEFFFEKLNAALEIGDVTPPNTN